MSTYRRIQKIADSRNAALLCLALSALVAGCAQVPVEPLPEEPPVIETVVETPEPVEEPEPVVVEVPKPEIEEPPAREEPVVTSFGLQDKEEVVPLDDPWKLVEQAYSLPADQASGLFIRAVDEFLKQGQVPTASDILDLLASYPMSRDEQVRIEILRSRIDLARDDSERALARLWEIDLGQVHNPDLHLEFLEILSDAQNASGRSADATATLIQLHDLSDSEARIPVQQRIIDQIRSLNPLDRSLLAVQSTHLNTPGWIALVEALDFSNPQFLYTDFRNWRKIYPDHPATLDGLVRTQEDYELTAYDQIALLLPLTSDFGPAAQAFYDGFMDAASQDPSPLRPGVVLYDIGNAAGLSQLYYRAAVDDGADLVVGPLGREAAGGLLEEFVGEVDTLMVTDIPEGSNSPHLFAINLSPEEEARMIAEKAWTDGYRQATVFRAYTPWGERVANAFIEKWEAIGGITVKNDPFPTDLDDHSSIIRKFLGIDKSIVRRKILEAHLDTQVSFKPRRNEDMDFIFLAANATQARITVPQLRFFQAHDLPVYATSYVYSGTPSPELDADLNGVVFPDMRWMLQGIDIHRLQMADKASEDAPPGEETLEEPDNEALPPDASAENAGEAETGAESDSEPAGRAFQAVASESPDIRVSPEHARLPDKPRPYRNTGLDRIYGLGLQSYLLAPRLAALRHDPQIQYSGPAMTVSLSGNGEVVRHPVWLMFRDGMPELAERLVENRGQSGI